MRGTRSEDLCAWRKKEWRRFGDHSGSPLFIEAKRAVLHLAHNFLGVAPIRVAEERDAWRGLTAFWAPASTPPPSHLRRPVSASSTLTTDAVKALARGLLSGPRLPG